MERESFEDEETATFLNAHFVPLKVDREERPDLDSIYMDAVQSMTGQGGWPLSVFLTPDGTPFFAGTYFPKEPMHGMPSFRQVLEGVAEAWRERRADLERTGPAGPRCDLAGRLARELSRSRSPRTSSNRPSTGSGDPSTATWGGFGAAPKFPQPMTLEFVLRMVVRGIPGSRAILAATLDRMAAGGIYDQLGGGFSRYSTDATWHVPHFEKMLYDNAQLAQLYTRAWLVTREDRYRRVAADTLEYLIREMRHPDGGFFSSQDADSEGVEGKFFAWSWDELVVLIGEDAAEAFGATQAGNWEGTNVLWLRDGAEPVGSDLADARRVLFEARGDRIRPATDDKVLTAWNAMAIQAFAEAGRAFGRPDFLHAATACANFIGRHLRDPAGRLLRSWRDGMPGGRGSPTTTHSLRRPISRCSERREISSGTKRRRVWYGDLVELFADRENGGFFQSGIDDDPLVIRPKELYDNAVPSGNSAAADVLQRMSLLTGDPRRRGRVCRRSVWCAMCSGAPRPGSGTRSLPWTSTSARPERSPSSAIPPTHGPGHSWTKWCGRASSRTPSSRSPTPETVRRSKRSRSSATVRRSTACPPRTCVSASRVACPSPARKISRCNSRDPGSDVVELE